MHRQRFDTRSICLILAAIGLYYFHFYNTPWDKFTIDAPSQAAYVKHLVEYGALPTVEHTTAAHHPPAFYVMAASFFRLAQVVQNDPISTARHAAMICFVVFTLMSVNLLRLMLPPRSGGYYAALMVLLFWPIGVTMGARLMCDIFLYAGEAGVIFYLARWFQTRTVESLSGAFLWAGVSVLGKNSGSAMLALDFCVLFLAVYQYRCDMRMFLRGGLFLSILFAVACCMFTFLCERGAWTTQAILFGGSPYDLSLWWRTFAHFDLFLFAFDSDMGLSHDIFWNMFLHSLLLGNGAMIWGSIYIPLFFNVLWLAIIVYGLEGMLSYGRKLLRAQTAYILLWLFVGMLTFSMMFVRIRMNNTEYSDARFIYPVVAVIALWHGTVIEQHRLKGRARLAQLGMVLAAGFLVLTPALFMIQNLL